MLLLEFCWYSETYGKIHMWEEEGSSVGHSIETHSANNCGGNTCGGLHYPLGSTHVQNHGGQPWQGSSSTVRHINDSVWSHTNISMHVFTVQMWSDLTKFLSRAIKDISPSPKCTLPTLLDFMLTRCPFIFYHLSTASSLFKSKQKIQIPKSRSPLLSFLPLLHPSC